MDYKETLNLPKTSFPMKADLPKREPLFFEQWEKDHLYQKIQENRKNSPAFILHDGPPYANGDIHIGHALNKILKDIIIRYKTMQGFRTPYVPGWDCHGLPVELQLFKELGKTKHTVDRLDFRAKARQYALKYIDIQKSQFKRLGILGEWENPYLTMNFSYQASIMECFWDLYQKGYIYKGLKPIYWCASCETALAEAEVEYENKTSPSIYVKFALTQTSAQALDLLLNTSVLIWTTTPWTLPGNVAVAVHPEAEYVAFEIGEETLIAAQELIPKLQNLMNWASIKILKTFKGKDLEKLECQHPFIDRKSLLILGSHVTLDQGTGCVHTAPGHGQEDYEIGLVYHLPILSPVNAQGQFTNEVELFKGQSVFSANRAICDLLKERGALLLQKPIEHTYPHCWRCQSPVIFRATPQWFLGVDRKNLRQNSLKAIDEVKWIPSGGKNRISSMIETRPDWCLSRQRLWGVPFPIFYCKQCNKEFLDNETAQKIIQKVKKEGACAWFKYSVHDWLGETKKCASCGKGEFSKEEDIMDVWFDSGISHHAVLNKVKGLQAPADLYLEGSDQHRGWFQTSLLAAMSLSEKPPFKAVLTHGFVVDGEGKKMSKSSGNVIAPQEVIKNYGADILRLWVSSTDFFQDIRISEAILRQIADTYRKMRNTFRYLLGNLFDYDSRQHQVNSDELSELDQWVLSRLFNVHEKVSHAYQKYEFCKIYHLIDQFCIIELSAFYFDILKDSLYTLPPKSKKRKAAQSVLFEILRVLNGLLSPILVVSMEEIWQSDGLLGGPNSSVHLTNWPTVDQKWYDELLEKKWEFIQEIRSEVLKVLEDQRKSKVIGSSLEAQVELVTDREDILGCFENSNLDLKAIFIVSQASLKGMMEPWPQDYHLTGMKRLGIKVSRASGEKCQRCWNYAVTVGESEAHPLICHRCIESVSEHLRGSK
ncbi:MAG: isoleucine--tRNA ligase [Chlamydiae bacterium]|nr:isoleucine--tRNA ligase [Chlamydiota bacterium]MBI3276738.1 isoleucine--tRNA ligase [Chlamydiota bacterium]